MVDQLKNIIQMEDFIKPLEEEVIKVYLEVVYWEEEEYSLLKEQILLILNLDFNNLNIEMYSFINEKIIFDFQHSKALECLLSL